ncbi:haloacid dehalogenase type II [Paraburkholderia rhizosphaerae]|uniref:(S)-2-haloacid dehalogenase n=1 Tax=Paraburkholderia rhizosphaerae TaxID=480658 RepID=A0A4V6QD15_9BURK|nr:haloacid dehalogenase type II [Paraburkholderia rhizosphaerae]TDY45375.1 2-haloacid dehalogenase [Paraburkholderia rhizosphaerae]
MKPIKGVVFDLYGTLYDVHSVASLCSQFYPGRGLEISMLWRQKQLEYTWLRSLMGSYAPFEQVTDDALGFVSKQLKLNLTPGAHEALCNEYLQIKPYPEVPGTLAKLRSLGLPLAILSNGSRHSIRSVVNHSDLAPQFDYLLSVDEVSVFKPHHAAYELAEQRMGIARGDLLFVSSNAWDASGARHFGFTVCWVNRSGNTFDELGERPDRVIAGLDELVGLVGSASA